MFTYLHFHTAPEALRSLQPDMRFTNRTSERTKCGVWFDVMWAVSTTSSSAYVLRAWRTCPYIQSLLFGVSEFLLWWKSVKCVYVSAFPRARASVYVCVCVYERACADVHAWASACLGRGGGSGRGVRARVYVCVWERVSEWKKRVVCLLDSFKCTLHTHTNTGINKLTCKTDYIQTYKASYITRLKRDSVFQLNHAVKAAATDTVRFCFKLLYVKQCGADLTEHTQSPITTRHWISLQVTIPQTADNLIFLCASRKGNTCFRNLSRL